MRNLVLAVLLTTSCLVSAARAQLFDPQADPEAGKHAGSIIVRLRAIGVIPENTSSSVSLIGGSIDVTKTPAPEVDISYFFTDHIAAELIAASTRHSVSAVNTALGHVDVGSVWVLPPTLTAQWHFLPQSRFAPMSASA